MRRKPIHKLQREIDDLDVNLDALDSEVDTKTQIDNSAAESVDDTYSASKIEELIAAIPSGGEVEGTSVLSTGETGGTKFLREDGDGTCSWQTPAGGSPTVATGAEVDTGTDNTKMVTPKAMEDSSYAKTSAIPVKATATEVNTGTDDAKFVTSLALANSGYGAPGEADNAFVPRYPESGGIGAGSSVDAKTDPPVDADRFLIYNSESSDSINTISFENLIAYLNTLYARL